MDAVDFNGGNAAEVARETYNLETNKVVAPETPEKAVKPSAGREEGQGLGVVTKDHEINGDHKHHTIKKEILSPVKREILSPESKKKVRKFKVNLEDPEEKLLQTSPRTNKRKFPEAGELHSSDIDDPFYGFDRKEASSFEANNNLLQKLIAELEPLPASPMKRRKLAMSWKNLKNADNMIEELEGNTTDSEDHKMVIDNDQITPVDASSIKSEKSANSTTSATSNRSRKSKGGNVSRGASPGNPVRQKVGTDMNNPIYREPFIYGWKRELVYRATNSDSSGKRQADIYYYTPEGRKTRSFREVAELLGSGELKVENFTFHKEPIGINDPEKEIIRDAKKGKDAYTRTPKQVKKPVELPVKKITPKKTVEKHVVPPSPAKISPKVTKTPIASFKIKLPAKKATPKKEIKSPPIPVAPEPEVASPPQWNSPTRRNQQMQIVEKSPPIKTKRLTKKKQASLENDQRQHFMVSVCAGYHALSRIFQYLKVQELLRAARVCRMWRDLAAHPSLWKTVRMKNSQVTDWDGLADTLKRRGTQHLDLRKMLIVDDAENLWQKFVTVIPRVTTLTKLELCRCTAMVVEQVIRNCPQLQVLSATTIKCDSLSLESIGNLSNCNDLKLKAASGMSLVGDLTPLLQLSKLTSLSLTSVKDLGKKKVEIIQDLENLETLELGECSDFPEKFGTQVLLKLQKLERLRLEKGSGTCCTFDILEGISQLEKLNQLELVNFDVKNGFDNYLGNCKNIKRLLVIPTYISQSATSNNMILGGVTKLSSNLTHLIWGVTQELLKVTELFVDQLQANKNAIVDSIPVLKPVPCLKLIEDIINNENKDQKEEKQQNLSNPQIEVLPLPRLQKLLLTALPTTRVKILKIPFHATWRQSFNDSTTQ